MDISFKGTQITNNADGSIYQLIGYDWQPAIFAESVIDIKAPLGLGYWSKYNGQEAIEHKLSIAVRTSSVSGFRALLQGLSTAIRGTVSIPDFGDYTNCRLSSIDNFQITKSESKFIVQTNLTFTQYPS